MTGGLIPEEGKPLTREGLFVLVCDEVFRDGLIEEFEEKIVKTMAQVLRLSKEVSNEAVSLSNQRYKEGKLGTPRPLSPLNLYGKTLYMILSDDYVDSLEFQLMKALRKLFHIDDATHMAVVRKLGYRDDPFPRSETTTTPKPVGDIPEFIPDESGEIHSIPAAPQEPDAAEAEQSVHNAEQSVHNRKKPGHSENRKPATVPKRPLKSMKKISPGSSANGIHAKILFPAGLILLFIGVFLGVGGYLVCSYYREIVHSQTLTIGPRTYSREELDEFPITFQIATIAEPGVQIFGPMDLRYNGYHEVHMSVNAFYRTDVSFSTNTVITAYYGGKEIQGEKVELLEGSSRGDDEVLFKVCRFTTTHKKPYYILITIGKDERVTGKNLYVFYYPLYSYRIFGGIVSVLLILCGTAAIIFSKRQQ